jgi:hypothetical protein
MTNENQHWVPKFLIRNLADADGRVLRLDENTNEVTKTTIASKRTKTTIKSLSLVG